MSPRTEKEKMLAGESYNCLAPDLKAEREKTKALLRLFSRTEEASERQDILRQLLGQIGQHSIIEPPFYCSYGQNIQIGDHVYLNVLCTILDNNEVHIGHHVMIGPGVQIYTAAHRLEAEVRNPGWEVARPIVIEDNVWLGGRRHSLAGGEDRPERRRGRRGSRLPRRSGEYGRGGEPGQGHETDRAVVEEQDWARRAKGLNVLP